jgi:outer membrane lipopolysaccharide assembly protein LptE/RlpB
MKKINSLLLILMVLSLSACKIYSLSGASISPDTKTVSVAYIENNAALVNPTLSQTLTESLKDRIVSQTGLQLLRTTADLDFEGTIIDYTIKPIAIQGNEFASQNRLTISVKIKFSNNKDETKSFEQVFTRYADYPGTQNLSTVESELIKTINTQLIDDIFNKAFVNW